MASAPSTEALQLSVAAQPSGAAKRKAPDEPRPSARISSKQEDQSKPSDMKQRSETTRDSNAERDSKACAKEGKAKERHDTARDKVDQARAKDSKRGRESKDSRARESKDSRATEQKYGKARESKDSRLRERVSREERVRDRDRDREAKGKDRSVRQDERRAKDRKSFKEEHQEGSRHKVRDERQKHDLKHGSADCKADQGSAKHASRVLSSDDKKDGHQRKSSTRPSAGQSEEEADKSRRKSGKEEIIEKDGKEKASHKANDKRNISKIEGKQSSIPRKQEDILKLAGKEEGLQPLQNEESKQDRGLISENTNDARQKKSSNETVAAAQDPISQQAPEVPLSELHVENGQSVGRKDDYKATLSQWSEFLVIATLCSLINSMSNHKHT